MFLFVFAFLSQSLIQCPSGIAHIYSTVKNITVDSADGWFYFYSEYLPLGDTLQVRLNPTDSAKLYVGDGLLCPSADEEVQLTAAANSYSSHSFKVKGDPQLSIFGIHASQGTNVILSVIGENPNKTDKTEWITISSIFLALCFVLLIMLFVHAILARGHVHYQVEVEE